MNRVPFSCCAMIALSACYGFSDLPSGAPCVPGHDSCPIGQTCESSAGVGSCRPDGWTGDHAPGDAGSADAGSPSDAGSSRIVYVESFVERGADEGATDSFTARARAKGNAVVLHVSCAGSAVATAVSVSAPGWTFMQLGSVAASTSSTLSAATFVAIAPDAQDTAVAVSWWGSGCDDGKSEVGDEFATTDPAGGAITFDGWNTTRGSGDCIGSVTTGHAGDAVWAACGTTGTITAVGPGFIQGAGDDAGHRAAYAITPDPRDTVESVRFSNSNAPYVLSMVTLKSQ